MSVEPDLVRRVRYERERRGMTYAELARRMAAAGCPIHQSALHKVENGVRRKGGELGPPRRFTVDELHALGRVFELPLDELLLPPEVAHDPDARRALASLRDAELTVRAARANAAAARAELDAFRATHP